MSDSASFNRRFHNVLEDILGWNVTYADEDGPATVESWDSLAQIRLVNALETEFRVRLPDTALLEEQTVASLKRLLVAQEALS